MLNAFFVGLLLLLGIVPFTKQYQTPLPASSDSVQNVLMSEYKNPLASNKPSPNRGLVMNPKTVEVTIMAGTSVKAFDLISKGATGFSLYGYPTTYGPGINWSPSSGGITKGSTIPVNIQVNYGVAPGTYTGTGILNSIPEGASSIEFPVTVHVTANPNGPLIQVISPNGGEAIQAGSTYRITWSSTNIDKVSIGYKSCDSCLGWIATNITNVGYYDWIVNVGNTTNTQFRIYLIGYKTGTGSSTDTSDTPFTVLPLTPTPTVPIPTITPTPTATPTPTPTISISSVLVRTCSVDSSCYPFLTNVEVNGSGFAPNSRVRLTQVSPNYPVFYGTYVGGDGSTKILTDFVDLPNCYQYAVSVHGSTGIATASGTISSYCP